MKIKNNLHLSSFYLDKNFCKSRLFSIQSQKINILNIVFKKSFKKSTNISTLKLKQLCVCVEQKNYLEKKQYSFSLKNKKEKLICKGKSVKFRNYLQFVLYQELKNIEEKNKNLQNKKEKVKDFLKLKGLAKQDLDPVKLEFLGTNVFKLKKKWGSFFPYRKSFVCYWLLPIVGFVGYFYGNNLTSSIFDNKTKINQDYLLLQNSNILSFNSVVQDKNLISESNKQEYLQNLFSVNFVNPNLNNSQFKISPIFFGSVRLDETNLASLLLKPLKKVPNLKYQFWYCTNLVGSCELIKDNNYNSTKINIYPSKYYGLPFLKELVGSNNHQFFLTSSVQSTSQKKLVKAFRADTTLDKNVKSLKSNNINKKLLSKISMSTKKGELFLWQSHNNSKLLQKAKFINLNKSNIFTYFSQVQNNFNEELVKENLLGINNTSFRNFFFYKKEKVNSVNPFFLSQLYLPKKNGLAKQELENMKLSKTLSEFSSLNTTNTFSVNPILSYKKASVLLDYVSEDLKIRNKKKEGNSILKLSLPKQGLLKSFKKEYFILTDTFYLNKIIQNNNLISSSLKNKLSFTKFNTNTNFNTNLGLNNNPFRYSFHRISKEKKFLDKNNKLSNQNKLNFLEEMIYFLENTKKLTVEPNTKINNILSKPKFNFGQSKDSNINITYLKPLKIKLTKDQLYFLVLNSLKNSLDSFLDPNLVCYSKSNLNNNQLENSQNKDLKCSKSELNTKKLSFITSSNNLSEINSSNLSSLYYSKPLKKHILKLNHPLLFSNFQSNFDLIGTNNNFGYFKNSTINSNILSKSTELSEPSTTDLDYLNKIAYSDFEFLFLPLETSNFLNKNLFFKKAKLAFIKETFKKTPLFIREGQINKDINLNQQTVVKLNNNYIDFVFTKLKKIVKPCYPTIFRKQLVKTFLRKQDLNVVLETKTNKKMSLEQTQKTNLVDSFNCFNKPLKKRIYSLMRSTLSKKQSKELKKSSLLKTKNKKNTKIILNSAIPEVQQKTFQFLKIKKPVNINININININKEKNKNLKNKKEKVSSVALLKNRIFILKSNKQQLNLNNTEFQDNTFLFNYGLAKQDLENLNKKTNNNNIVNNLSGSSYFEKLEKRKYNQKKHRRKKQRKETRHRKKRKRFYPRPSWSRYKMYENLLKTLFVQNTYKQLGWNTNLITNSFLYLKTKEKSDNKSKLNLYFDNAPLYQNKDFYQIKQSVLAELKRSFWKSYWLRSNLKPYLNNIKFYLKEIEKSSTKETLYFNMIHIINYLSGLNCTNFTDNTSSDNTSFFFKKEKNPLNYFFKGIKKTLPTAFIIDSNNLNNQYILSTDPILKNRNNFLKGLYTQNKWQFMTQINEHNRIMYNLINENLILNIRENLTLNGQFKARPFKVSGKQKLRNLLTLKQNITNPNNPQGNPLLTKLGKAVTSFKNTTKYNGNFSNHRIYWSINKTNLGSFKTLNKLKSLWVHTKNRDQSKANKTKKIIHDIKQNYSSFLKQKITNKLQLNSSMFLFVSTGTLQNVQFETNNFIENKNLILLSNTLKKPTNIFFLKNNSNFNTKKESNSLENNILSFNNIEKLKLSLQLTERKLHQKEQKLLSLGFLPLNVLDTKTFNKSTSLESFNMLKKSNSLLPGHLKNFSNEINYWWDASKMQFIPNFNNNYNNNNNNNNQEFYSILNSLSQKNNKENLTLFPFFIFSKTTTIGIMTFLFHFCSFISLISISQIRDLIKFSFILLSKVSKIYINFVYSSFNLFINLTKNIDFTRNLKKDKSPFKAKDFLTGIKTTTLLNQAFSSKKNITSGLENNQLKKVDFYNKKKFLSYQGKEKEKEYSANIVPYTYKGRFLKNFFLKKGLAKQDLENYKLEQVENQLKLKFLQMNSFNQKQKTGNLFLNKGTLLSNRTTQETYTISKVFSNPISYYFLVNFLKNNKSLLKSLDLQGLFKKSSINLNILYTWYSILFYSSMNAFSFSISNLSFFTYSYFLKSLSIVENLVRSIYSFFEKPGELIIDWLAYFFLVEWSSDLTNTIPDTIDTNFFNFLTKLTRSERFPLILTTNFSTDFVNRVVLNNSVNISLFSNSSSFVTPFSLLTGGLIQRRILSIYEIFLNIACRPDTDLILRQQKGFVFWDIWSDLFIKVAENSNINISELSNLKEEQNNLLEKLIKSDMLTKKEKKEKYSLIMNLKTVGKNLIDSKKLLRAKSTLNKFFEPTVKNLKLNKINSSKVSVLSNNLSKTLLISKTLIWSSSQFLSYQGKDTELFIDLHPPKSFSHITSIKYSESINQPIGLVLCQVFSGIFYKQVAKNLLVVGPQGDEKSLLIQAIAGETELKIITDNANRYAMVFRGVAVGIKLLRDVFEALTLHTPCIFLLEDIHAIGERRPFLISDDENIKGLESSICFANRDEIHEKNQVIYQLTKHIVSHYKKPYKGDFSLLIPTNHFCFDLFNSTNATNIQKRQKSNLTSLSPLPLATKDSSNTNSNTGENKTTPQDFFKDSASTQKNKNLWQSQNILASSLQLPKNQLLAPPATSPFSVLVLKEEKKLKPKKSVKEFPWSGLPGEQYSNIAKATYSIRVKVALLADIVLSNLSVKLDMITDLLVIIDSVKGNRGFVVFATTHIPYILDPALRRPGRFDETLSLPQIPNLLSRWQLSKSNINLWHYQSGQNSFKKVTKIATPFFLNYSEPFSTYPNGITTNLWQINTIKNLTKQFSLLSSNNLVDFKKVHKKEKLNLLAKLYFQNSTKRKSFLKIINTKIFLKTLKKSNKSFKSFDSLEGLDANYGLALQGHKSKIKDSNKEKVNLKINKKNTLLTLHVYNLVSKIFLALNQSTFFNKKSNNKWGDFSFSLIHSENLDGISSFQNKKSFFGKTLNKVLSKDSLVYTSLYSSPHIFKQHLTILMAGQLGYFITNKPGNIITLTSSSADFNNFGQNKKEKSISTLKKGSIKQNQLFSSDRLLNFSGAKAPLKQIGLNKITVFDNTWRTASSLIFSFIQKRWIYSSNSARKNTILPLKQSLLFGSPALNSLFDFGLEGYKTEIPSPPSSNILLPAKRYENYKRTFIYSQLKRKTNTSISETIQLHQQQRLIKRLYKIPLKQFFRSEILTNFNSGNSFKKSKDLILKNNSNFSSFSNASIILTSLENIQQKPTSINWYFRQRILNRHRNYLSNQWWNGQLQEHNTESTFLSDIDWRYTISSSLPEKLMNKANNLMIEHQKKQKGDLFIDFPDSEQFYNPKNQRWINTSGSWNSWFDFHKTSMAEYSSHYMFECLTNAYKCLDQNRELLDYSVIKILEKGMLNISLDDEIEILEIFK